MHVSEETAKETRSAYIQLTFAINRLTGAEQSRALEELGPEGAFRAIFPCREPADGGPVLAAHSVSTWPSLFDEVAYRYVFLVREEALPELPPDPKSLLETMWEKYKSQWPSGFAPCTVYFSNYWMQRRDICIGHLSHEKWEVLSLEKRSETEDELDHEDFISAIEAMHDLSTHISPTAWNQKAADVRQILAEAVADDGAKPGQIMQSFAMNLTKMFQPEGDSK